MDDSEAMDRAIALASAVRTTTSPNPWVGCVVLTTDGTVFEGATQPPGGPHAEAVALAAAGPRAQGSTVVTTLEPCAHHGRTPPCADALIDAGVGPRRRRHHRPRPPRRRPGHRSPAGGGHRRPRSACGPTRSPSSSPPTSPTAAPAGPTSSLKLAATLDGRTAAADGTSQWITGPEARADAHRLRAESDAVLVGAGTVRADDPSLTVAPRRHARGPSAAPGRARPRRRRAPRCSRRSSSAATSARCSTRSGTRACSRSWSRVARPSPGPSTGPAWSTATSCTSRPRSPGATTAARCSPDPARRRSTTCGAAASSASPQLGDDIRIDVHATGAGAPDVHRHRRGAGLGGQPRRIEAAHRGEHRARGRVDRGLDRGQRLLPHRRRPGRGLVGGRRHRRDATPARTSASSPRATR